VSTTGFITQFLKNAAPDVRVVRLRVFRVANWLPWLAALLWLCLAFVPARATEVTQLRTERVDDGVILTASVRFDLPPVVEDALGKGIPLFFVVQADIYRDRWYWTDRRVGGAVRTVRLTYQPLTRHWRVNVVPGLVNSPGLRAAFNQNFDSLQEALASVQRVGRWRIADLGDIDPGAVHFLQFRFWLDLTQLPRPFQIGVAGQREWTIQAEARERLYIESAKPAPVAPPTVPPASSMTPGTAPTATPSSAGSSTGTDPVQDAPR
jgi:hypothetical protein